MNGTKEPIHFCSKLERKRWMKQHGWREYDRHVGAPGGESDKSKHTASWAAVDQATLDGAKALLERVGSQKSGWRDPDKSPLGITSEEGLIRYMTDLRAAENGNTFGFSDR